MPKSARPGSDLSASAVSELNELLWALPTTLDPWEIVAVLLEKSARLFDAPLACVFLRDGAAYELAGCYGFTDKKGEQLWESLGMADRAPEPLALSGPELAALAGFGKRRLGAVLALPLKTPAGLLGWVLLARLDPVPFSDLEQQFVAMIVGRVALAVETARLYQSTQARSRELELLYEIAQLLVSTVRLDELLSRLVRRMTEAFGLTGCMIRLVEPDAGTVPVRALHHRDPEELARLLAYFASHPLKVGVGRTGQIFKLKQPYLARNLLDDPFIEESLKEAIGVGSVVAAPLAVRGRVVGVLFWFRAGKQRPLSEAMIPMITHLANQVAIAIDNAQLVSEMERQIADATADVVADKEAMASAMQSGRAYVTRLGLDVRRQIHNILGLAGLIDLELQKPEPDRELAGNYLERLMAGAEAVNDRLEGLFRALRGRERPEA